MARTMKAEIDQVQKDFLRAKGVRSIDELTEQEKNQLQDLITSETEYDEETRQAEIAAKLKAEFKAERAKTSVQEVPQQRPLSFLFYTRTFGCFLAALVLILASRGSIVYILAGVAFGVFGVIRLARIFGKTE